MKRGSGIGLSVGDRSPASRGRGLKLQSSLRQYGDERVAREAHSGLDEQRLRVTRRASKPQPARLADHAGAGSRLASLQFNFGGSSSLRSVRDGASRHACRRAKPASVCARRSANIWRWPSFDRGENFIDAGKHAPNNLDHLAPQNVEFAAQPLDVALAPFTAHRTSSQNCSNSARNSNGGPQEPSDSTGVAV